MSVDPAYTKALNAVSEQVKARVELVLSELGLTHADLSRKLGYRTPSGYWKMYSVGTFDLRKAAQIAAVLNIAPERILLGSQPSSVRQYRPYVEDRLEAVEREVRSLRLELKNQHKNR